MRIPVPQETKVRTKRCRRGVSTQSLYHAALRRRPQHPVIRKMRPAEEIHAGSERPDGYFMRLQLELKPIFQERSNIWNERFKPAAVF